MEMRVLDDDMIERHLENLDRRVARVEQILPTLATRDDDVREECDRLREHMTICMERVRRDIHALIDAIEFMKHLDS